MSSTRGDIVTDTLRALRRLNDDDARDLVESYINRFYTEICGIVPIKALRRRVEIDLSDSAYDEGMWLPSNLAGIIGVKDVDDGYDFVERDRATIEADDSSNRYYSYVPTGEPAFYGADLELRQGATTFTSTLLTTDYSDYYVRFGNEPGYYLLTATKTFTPTYYGPSLSQQSFVIRTTNTQKLVCVDTSDDEITDRDVYVYYWQLPTPLYRDFEIPLLPSTRALELKVMKEAMTIIGKRQLSAKSYDPDIDKAMDDLRKLCPPVAPMVRAKDQHGVALSFSKNPFTDRD